MIISGFESIRMFLLKGMPLIGVKKYLLYIYCMSQYFPPYRSSGRNVKVELDLSNFAAKTDLKK